MTNTIRKNSHWHSKWNLEGNENQEEEVTFSMTRLESK